MRFFYLIYPFLLNTNLTDLPSKMAHGTYLTSIYPNRNAMSKSKAKNRYRMNFNSVNGFARTLIPEYFCAIRPTCTAKTHSHGYRKTASQYRILAIGGVSVLRADSSTCSLKDEPEILEYAIARRTASSTTTIHQG